MRDAVALVNDFISAKLSGLALTDQREIDELLIDQSRIGCFLGTNITTAVSLATLACSAAASGIPVWKHLLGNRPASLPVPEVQIFGGGRHAAGSVDIQDFMVVSPSASSVAEALDRAAEIFRAAGEILERRGQLRGLADEGGYWPPNTSNELVLELLVEAILASGLEPGRDVWISLDIAASSIGEKDSYRLSDGGTYSSEAFSQRLDEWLQRYPILCVEDPFHEDDDEAFRQLMSKWGTRIQVIGDDYLASQLHRIERAARDKSCNSVVIKPSQVGTVTETLKAFEAARATAMGTILSARSGDTEDVTITHLAVGWRVGQIKVGGIARSERCAKWNELLRIEESAGLDGTFAGSQMIAKNPLQDPRMARG